MNKVYTKETILKLLSGMSSEKEIRKYLERFSSDDFRFAVIKVGGAVIQNDLENLVSSISFLHEVGLKPIIVHGGGPSLSSELKAKEIEFSFLGFAYYCQLLGFFTIPKCGQKVFLQIYF